MSKIRLCKSYYTSLCFYGLKNLGFIDGTVNSRFLEEAKILDSLGKDFRFCAPSAGGPIFTFVYQIPSYLNPQSVDELNEIKDCIIDFVNSQSIEVFLKKYPFKTRFWESWYNEAWLNYLFANIKQSKNKVISVIEFFFKFLCGLWTEYHNIYNQKLLNYNFIDLEEKCLQLDIFHQWEKLLGLCYPYQSFNLIICPESFTTASSLGPEQVVISSHYGWKMMKNSVIHEIGVRFFNIDRFLKHPLTNEIIRDDYFGLIKLIETEVCYRKKELIPDLIDDPFIKGMQLEKLINWRNGINELETVEASLAKWYSETKEKKLL